MKGGSEHLFGFREHLRVLGRSEATVSAYGEHVKNCIEALGDVKTVTRRGIEDYIAGLMEYRTREGKPYRMNTINLKVRSIKRFFEYLEKANVIFINPAELIPEPRPSKELPRNILSREEAARVLDQPNLGTLTGIRDRAVLEVFYSTGIRLNELCRLTVHDADLQGGMLRVTGGKGKKDRVVPLGRHAIRFLREYVTKVRPHFTRKNRTERRLFMDYYGRPLSKEMASISIRSYARAAGIKKKVSAHTFRHTFATELVKNGADITAVQKMLGHSDLDTTRIYLRTAGVDVKSAHKKTHPREKDREEKIAAKPELERIRPKYERKSPEGARRGI
jgi:integrase/recombinase XerD